MRKADDVIWLLLLGGALAWVLWLLASLLCSVSFAGFP